MRRDGAVGLTAVLGVLAFVVTASFLFWLYRQSATLDERVEPALEEEEVGNEGLPVTLEELAADPDAAIGRQAALEEAQVGAALGRGVFVLRLDPEGEFPVLLNRDLLTRDIDLYGGDIVTVWGRVYTLNDSIRGAWVEAGAVDPAQREAIPGTASFLLADSLDIR